VAVVMAPVRGSIALGELGRGAGCGNSAVAVVNSCCCDAAIVTAMYGNCSDVADVLRLTL
jgi:hypothetical protein